VGILIVFSVAFAVREIVGPGARSAATTNRALAWSEKGDPDRAFEGLRRALASHPESAEAWARAGRAIEDVRPLEAATHFRRAVELDPKSPEYRYELARTFAKGDVPSEAWDALQEVFALKADHADALTLAAALAASEGQVMHAIGLWTVALEATPSDPDRVRWDPRFDPIRGDRRFVEAVLDLRVPGTFVPEETDLLTPVPAS
jgi:cytochrome c-type biogenesis protein CcmH/NrfG